jgi:hypothetical protein
MARRKYIKGPGGLKFPIPEVRYVESDDGVSCVLACLAMVTGKTIIEVREGMKQYWYNEASENGVGDEAFEAYLAARGYAVQHISHDYVPEDKLVTPWPPKPWAPIHVCDVYYQGPHAVVMLWDGRILDPNDTGLTSLDQYHRVYAVQGIWKVSDAEPIEVVNR